MDFRISPHPTPASAHRRAEILADPGFGKHFTDHTAAISWTQQDGWHDARVIPYGPLQVDPAAAVLHYAQEVFEGLKAYRHQDGSVWAFRPEANADRMARSARRLALPELDRQAFLDSITQLVRIDRDWVPEPGEGGRGEASLYLRPFMFATESFLGVRPAASVEYMVIASPVGAYFPSGVKPVSIWLSTQYSRAAPGGTGAAKCGGNYAASLAAMLEAGSHGCAQVCFLDAAQQRYVEELGGMNIFFVHRDGTLVTPSLTGSILEGVTRSSVITLAEEEGMKVLERPVEIEEWRSGVADGSITEVFACGTAAVITPVGRLVWDGGEVGSGATGERTMALRQRLVDIQYGRSADPHGWLQRLL